MPSYVVTITGSIDPIGFRVAGYKKTAKAIFNITSKYPKLDVKIIDSSYHISLLLNNGQRSVFDHELYGHYDWGNLGTVIVGLPEHPYSADLSKYFTNGYLSFYQAECEGHLNMWYNSDIYIIMGAYYYQYKTWKTSSTNYGWQFVTKGKYYEGLVPNL